MLPLLANGNYSIDGYRWQTFCQRWQENTLGFASRLVAGRLAALRRQVPVQRLMQILNCQGGCLSGDFFDHEQV